MEADNCSALSFFCVTGMETAYVEINQTNINMSNNKTIVPGMGAQTATAPAGFAPENSSAPNYNGTVFPGMKQAFSAPSAGKELHKPIMGFLYSVSRTANGEYWPLYLGPNSIGRAATSAINLAEATVSDNHAQIVVREMQNPDSVLVFIQDTQSTCGTTLNGSTLGFNPEECHNGDIIRIGEHYEFYLILIDVKSLGLKPSPDFLPVNKQAAPAWQAPAPGGPFAGGFGGPFGQQNANQPQQRNEPQKPNGGTIVM